MSRTLLRFVGGAAIVSFLAAAFTPAVNLLSYWLTPPRRTEPAQAIVVLGAGGVSATGELTTASMRGAMDGIALYRQGRAPLLVFSGSPGPARSEAEARAELARSCGVEAAAIMTSSRARTTNEEAQHIHALLAPRQVRKVLLIADPPGMSRATQVFERVGFEVVAAPWTAVLDLGGPPESRLALLRDLSMELVARVYYRVAGYL